MVQFYFQNRLAKKLLRVVYTGRGTEHLFSLDNKKFLLRILLIVVLFFVQKLILAIIFSVIRAM